MFARQAATMVALFCLLLTISGCETSTPPQGRPPLLQVEIAPASQIDRDAVDLLDPEPVESEESSEFDARWQRLAALRADVSQILRLQSADVEYMEDLMAAIEQAQESLIECVEDGRQRPYSVALRLRQLEDQRLGLLTQLQLARQRRGRLSKALQATRSLQRTSDRTASATRPGE